MPSRKPLAALAGRIARYLVDGLIHLGLANHPVAWPPSDLTAPIWSLARRHRASTDSPERLATVSHGGLRREGADPT